MRIQIQNTDYLVFLVIGRLFDLPVDLAFGICGFAFHHVICRPRQHADRPADGGEKGDRGEGGGMTGKRCER